MYELLYFTVHLLNVLIVDLLFLPVGGFLRKLMKDTDAFDLVDETSDEYIAWLLAQEAVSREKRLREVGLEAYSKPKLTTNKTFLRNIIKNTDSHNQMLRNQQSSHTPKNTLIPTSSSRPRRKTLDPQFLKKMITETHVVNTKRETKKPDQSSSKATQESSPPEKRPRLMGIDKIRKHLTPK
jgi:hypothetical protein